MMQGIWRGGVRQRACSGKERDCGQNSIPVRSKSAAQAGVFYICALRLLTFCLAMAAAIRKSIGRRALHWQLALAGVSDWRLAVQSGGGVLV
jgi:hypothetical protein